MEYVLFKYRRKMGISFRELAGTPMDVVLQDIDMMNLELEYRPQAAPQTGNNQE